MKKVSHIFVYVGFFLYFCRLIICMPQQNTPYNQPQPMEGMPPQGMPMGPMMPPPPFRRKSKTWRERIMNRYGMGMHDTLKRGELTVPQWLVGRPILFFFIAFAACTYVFGYPVPFVFALIASIWCILFFVGANISTRNWQHTLERTFLQKIFWMGLIVRMVWVVYSYFFFNPEYYHNTFGDIGDTEWYMDFGHGIADWVRDGMPISFHQLRVFYDSAIDDVGYPIWLGIEYLLTFDISDIFIPFFIKSILGAYCSVCIYRVAKRHFGVGTARMAAVFVALNPNMIYWCASMMKETEMVFLCCLFLDKTDFTLSTSNTLGFRQLLPGILIGLSLFFVRTALGLVAFLAIFGHIVFVSRRVMSNGKKVLAGVLVGITLLVGMGERLQTQSQELLQDVQGGGQKTNMEWRAAREGGNSFARYAGAAVFAPLIFTIPLPTFNQAEAGQIVQQILSGGSYIRNILSFFVILVMLLLLASGEWRKHVFVLAYTLGYLVILVFSGYAQSGRFHMPIWPMILLFAAYGVQIAKGNVRIRREFNIVLVAEVFICLAWNWFKLKGRGMI